MNFYALNTIIFWAVAPCNMLDVYRRFRGICIKAINRNATPAYNDSNLYVDIVFWAILFKLRIAQTKLELQNWSFIRNKLFGYESRVFRVIVIEMERVNVVIFWPGAKSRHDYGLKLSQRSEVRGQLPDNTVKGSKMCFGTLDLLFNSVTLRPTFPLQRRNVDDKTTNTMK